MTKRFVFGTTGAILTLLAINKVIGPFFYQNLTASAPIGLYRRSYETPKIGDYVVCRLPGDIRSWIEEDNTLLIKKIIARQGAEYEVNFRGLAINGKEYPIYPLKKVPNPEKGKFRVPEKKVMVVNDSPISFDSRYFGPIDEDLIIGKIKLLIDYDRIRDFVERWLQ